MGNTAGIRSSIVRRNRRNFKARRSYQHDKSLATHWPSPRPPTPEGGALLGGWICRIIRLCLGVDDRKVSLGPCLFNNGETYILDFALLHGPELYLGYIKVACKLIRIYSRCCNTAVYVIRS